MARSGEAPRRAFRVGHGFARGALLAAVLVASGAGARVAGQVAEVEPPENPIIAARYTEPTDRYTHGVLGDAIEWGALVMELENGTQLRVRLPEDRVFEDTEPRLLDVDGDGAPEVVVVETHIPRGARLSIYDEEGLVAATPHIGRTNRWLAPLGAADLDGDGFVELAYIDRPHLAKTLRIWRFRNSALEPVADLPGLTNHRIGEPDIAGGIRDCGTGLMVITANANWTRLIASRLVDGKIETIDIGPHEGRPSFARALTC